MFCCTKRVLKQIFESLVGFINMFILYYFCKHVYTSNLILTSRPNELDTYILHLLNIINIFCIWTVFAKFVTNSLRCRC